MIEAKTARRGLIPALTALALVGSLSGRVPVQAVLCPGAVAGTNTCFAGVPYGGNSWAGSYQINTDWGTAIAYCIEEGKDYPPNSNYAYARTSNDTNGMAAGYMTWRYGHSQDANTAAAVSVNIARYVEGSSVQYGVVGSAIQQLADRIWGEATANAGPYQMQGNWGKTASVDNGFTVDGNFWITGSNGVINTNFMDAGVNFEAAGVDNVRVDSITSDGNHNYHVAGTVIDPTKPYSLGLKATGLPGGTDIYTPSGHPNAQDVAVSGPTQQPDPMQLIADAPVTAEIGTQAHDQKDGDQTVTATGTIIDTVNYTGLIPNQTYGLDATLMDASGNPIDKARYSAPEVRFTPTSTNGSQDVPITLIDPLLTGTFTVYEELWSNGKLMAEHKVPGEQTQTFTVPTPSISTTASDVADGDQSVLSLGTVTDKVAYTNLAPGLEYTLTGQLVTSTGEVIDPSRYTTSPVTFTPDKTDGSQDMTFVLVDPKLNDLDLTV